MQRCYFHTTSAMARGRSFFFNKHRKVTDPALQDPDIFEKRARTLPLDDNYLDALKKLWEEKIGAERDLGLKAADNLVADRTTFGLPKLDYSSRRGPFRDLDELANAPESVKKIFSLEMGTRREKTDEWKRLLISGVNIHSLDNSSLEMRIGWTTALIRHWSMLVDEIAKQTPKKPVWLTHRIWLVINFRRKMLRQLRERNEESFQRVINELKIAYHVPKQPEHVKTRKAWAEAQLRSRVEKEKETRLEKLHMRYAAEKETRLAEMERRREELRKEREEIQTSLARIAQLELGHRPDQNKYQPSLVGYLTEVTNHAELFYHPKPTMTATPS